MKSSFTKGYEKDLLDDGSIVLKYKAKRMSPAAMASAGTLALIVLFPVSCAVTLPVAAIFNGLRQDLGDTNKLLWTTLALIFFTVILYFLVNTKATLTIKPYEGLIFMGKRLPFSDFQNLGTIDHPNARSKAGAAFVYAESHGKQIAVTKYIPLALADNFAKEIKSVSGMVWK